MRSIILGTNNPAKVEQVRGVLKSINVSVKGISELGVKIEVEEDGKTAQENARKKALTFAKKIKLPVLSMDNGLYLDGLEPQYQPGIHVRRIVGDNIRPSDAEVLHHYAEIIDALGGSVNGYWEYALALAYPDGCVNETTIISPRKFVSQISQQIVPEYPLGSIQIDPESGKYISEMSQKEQDLFWQKAIG